MADKLTFAGASIEISTTAAPTDLDELGFEGLSYTAIGGVGNLGDWSVTDNIISYNTLADDVVTKQKGVRDGGNPQLQCAYDSADAGQTAMIAAAKTSSSYAFKVTLSNGDVFYSRAVVGGGESLGGGGGLEDFILRPFSLGINQEPLRAATP